MPYISDALAKIRVRVVNKLIYASNTVFIAEVVDAFDSRSGEPLTYKYYRDGFKEQVAIAFSAYKAGRSAGNAACKKSQTAMSASSSSSAAQPSSPASAENAGHVRFAAMFTKEISRLKNCRRIGAVRYAVSARYV